MRKLGLFRTGEGSEIYFWLSGAEGRAGKKHREIIYIILLAPCEVRHCEYSDTQLMHIYIYIHT